MVIVFAAILSTLNNVSFATESEEDDETSNPTNSNVQPKKKQVKSCAIQLNELYLGKGTEDSMQFIELRRFCPKNIPQPKTKTLDGHFIVALDLGPPTKILLILNLNGERLTSIKENDDDVDIESMLHVTGTATTPEKSLTFVKREMTRTQKMQFLSHPNLYKILPTAEESKNPTAILLIYYKYNERVGLPISSLRLGFYTDRNNIIRYFDYVISDEQTAAIKNHVADFIIYGNQANNHANQFMQNVLNDGAFEIENQIIITTPTNDISMSSFSRCADKLNDRNAFDIVEPTPLKANKCTRSLYKPPYNFHGHGISSDGQRIGINVLHFVRHHQKTIGKLNWSPVKLASQMIGVNQYLLNEFEQRHLSSSIETPGRKRNKKKWKQLQVDSFDRDVIRSLIAGFYKNNTAPYFSDIFAQYKNYKKDNCVSYTTSEMGAAPSRWLPICCNDETGLSDGDEEPCNKRPNIPQCTPKKHVVTLDEGFTIGSKTFAKVLKDMGFHFGRIDNRVAILIRQDIVASRGRFLRILRENSARDTPYKITYLDEVSNISKYIFEDKDWQLKTKFFFDC